MASVKRGFSFPPAVIGYLFELHDAGWFLPRVWGAAIMRLGDAPVLHVTAGRSGAGGQPVTIRFAQDGTLQADPSSGELRSRDGQLRATAELSVQALTVRNLRGIAQLSLRPHPGPAAAFGADAKAVMSPLVVAHGGRCWELEVLSGNGRRQVAGSPVRQV